MRHDDDGAGEILQRGDQRMAHLEVEMVGGLVEQQQVGPFGDQDREREPRAFTAREMHHRLEHAVAAEAEAAEMIAAALLVPLRARADFIDAVCQRDQRGVARVEAVDFELREIADDEIGRRDAIAAADSGGSAPEMSFMSVDLPAPLRPRMPMRSPGLTERSDARDHHALAVTRGRAVERHQRLRQFVSRRELPLEAVELLVGGDRLELATTP